jgi:predicted small lipoprotein YifL
MKKNFFLFAVLSICLLALAACGQSGKLYLPGTSSPDYSENA